MKITTVIDPDREEEICIYTHGETPLIEAVRRLVEEETQLIGYREREAVVLDTAAVCCFTVETGVVYAVTADGSYRMRQRLYQLEAVLPPEFIRINQSCLANLRHIRRFDTSLSCTLRVAFDNGATDYVSRRNLKKVKEKIGL